MNLDLLVRPAVLLWIWILVAAFTLAELGTVRPVLRDAGYQEARAREPGARLLEARTQAPRRRIVAR